MTNSIISIIRIVTVSQISVQFYVTVGNYIRKTTKPSYKEDDMNNAIEKIRVIEWTYEKRSGLTNIPIGTLASQKSNQQDDCATNLKTTEVFTTRFKI